MFYLSWFYYSVLLFQSTSLWRFHVEATNTIGKGGKQELLLKNITQILDLLLENYDSSQHPNYRHGIPTLVHTNMLIRSMGPISELDMDERLKDSHLGPDTFFRNGRHSYVHTITVPNKLLRLTQDGDILYSMRLTIKAKCVMCLRNFPLDSQRCGLTFGSFAYPVRHIVYSWDKSGVSFVPGMALSQFDLVKSPFTAFNLTTGDGEFSVLQVNFELVRHAGFFLIQVYVPCILIVILSWVSFWINRESTSDRVGLGITAFLTLSTISLDTRTDLPKVHYATALDWFILMSFGYCMASLLEFAGVHYFTKINSGEKILDDEDDFDSGPFDLDHVNLEGLQVSSVLLNDNGCPNPRMTAKETQTEKKPTCFSQFLRCVVADDKYRRQRQRGVPPGRFSNSVSKIDQVSRILFPVSFLILNLFYWVIYAYLNETCATEGQRTQARTS